MGCIKKFKSAPTRNSRREPSSNPSSAGGPFWRGRGLLGPDAMYVIVPIFGLPLLIAGAMIDPQGLHLGGLITYAAIMLVAMPFLGWQLLAAEFVFPSAGRTRLGAVIGLWIGGTLVAVAAISFIASALSYPRPGVAIDPNGHTLVPFAPRAGLAIGL